MTQVISMNQALEARRKYPSLVCASPYEMSIKFPNSEDNFSITFQNNYPMSPPSVSLNGNAILIPIVQYWQSVFTVSDILLQLSCYITIPKPQPLQVNVNEIQSHMQSVPPSKIASIDGRHEFLSSLPTYSRAINTKKNSDSNIGVFKNKSKASTATIRQKSNLLTQNISMKQQLEAQFAQNSQAVATHMAQSKKIKIAQLKNENSKIDNDIQELQYKISSNKVSMDQFLTEYNKLKQQQAYNNRLSKLLSQKLDFF